MKSKSLLDVFIGNIMNVDCSLHAIETHNNNYIAIESLLIVQATKRYLYVKSYRVSGSGFAMRNALSYTMSSLKHVYKFCGMAVRRLTEIAD